MSWAPPNKEEWKRAIEEANSPRKQQTIRESEKIHNSRMKAYNQGLLTPHDLAEALAHIWLQTVDLVK